MSYLSFNTSDPKALFTNNFNEDFIIEEESSIGLVNLKFQPIEPVFDKTVNSSDESFKNVIRIGLSDNNTTSNLFNVVVDDINTEDLSPSLNLINPTNLENSFILPELAYQINNTIDMSEEKAMGLEFRVDTNSTPNANKVNFKFETFPYIDAKNLLVLEKVIYTELADQYKKNTTTSSNLDVSNEERLYCPDPFTKGNGFFRIRIDKFTEGNTANQNFGFTIALVQKNPIDFHATLQEDIVIGINCPHATHNYRYVTNDVYHNSTIAPANITAGGANNDVVELRRNGGAYQAVVYQAGGAEHILFEKEVSDLDGDTFDDYTHENLYPVIFFGAGDTNLILSTPRVHLTPYDVVIPYEPPLDDSATYGTVTPLRPTTKVNTISTFNIKFPMVLDSDLQEDPNNDAVNPITHPQADVGYRYLHPPRKGTANPPIFLEKFPGNDTTDLDSRKHLGRFLGFQLPEYKIQAVHSGAFSGENDFIPTFHSKMYFLECQNLELDTYTSIGGGKKNILLPMPLYNRFSNKYMTYEPNNLYMVKLKNINKIPLRSFRFRLLDQNLKPVNVVGRSDLTVVIDK